VNLIATTTEPNAADWFTAIGTVGTLALGLLLALFSLWDRRRNRTNEHRAQASKVYGLATEVGGNGTRGVMMTLNYEAVVHNNSDLPITDVVVMLGIEPPEAVVGINQTSQQETNVILPGETFTHRVPVELGYENDEVAKHDAFLWIAFTDASGTRWERRPGQGLVDQPGMHHWWARWRISHLEAIRRRRLGRQSGQ
jgi:hypothetical protein